MVRQPSNADADGVQELTLESVLTPTDERCYPFIEAIAGVNTDDPRAKQRLLAIIADDAYPRIHKALCCFGRSPTYLDSSFTTPLRIMYINKVADRATVASRAAWEAEDRTAAEEAAREAGRVAAEIDEIVEGLKATGVRDQAWTSAQSAQAAAHNAVLVANGSVQEYDSLVPQVSRGTNTDADMLEYDCDTEESMPISDVQPDLSETPMAFDEVIAFLNSELEAAGVGTCIRRNASKRKVFRAILKNKKLLEEPFRAHPSILPDLKYEYDDFVPSVQDHIVIVLKVMLLMFCLVVFATAGRPGILAFPQRNAITQYLEPLRLMCSENVTHAVAVLANTVRPLFGS